jgi:hypothetical protein
MKKMFKGTKNLQEHIRIQTNVFWKYHQRLEKQN